MIITNKATAVPVYLFSSPISVEKQKAGEDHERDRRMNMVKQGSDICIITTVLSELWCKLELAFPHMEWKVVVLYWRHPTGSENLWKYIVQLWV
jgi:hypothetical protein